MLYSIKGECRRFSKTSKIKTFDILLRYRKTFLLKNSFFYVFSFLHFCCFIFKNEPNCLFKGDIDQFLFFDYKKIYIRNQFSFQKFRFKNIISFCCSYVLTRVKKNKISKCGALGCKNQADKNSNIITLLTIIKMLL